MCVYSMIADSFIDRWKQYVPPPTPEYPGPLPQVPWVPPTYPLLPNEGEFFGELVHRAKEYDERTGQKDCELEDKKRILRELADKLGIKITFPDEPEPKKETDEVQGTD